MDESAIAGPSSRPEKRARFKADGGRDWDRIEETLLTARKRKVEIQTKAEIEMAKVDSIIEEVERDMKGKPKV